MLWSKLARRPTAARLELNSDEIPDLPVYAITDLADEFALAVVDAQVCLQGNRMIELEAGAGQRNILQVGYTRVRLPRLVLPVQINHVRA